MPGHLGRISSANLLHHCVLLQEWSMRKRAWAFLLTQNVAVQRATWSNKRQIAERRGGVSAPKLAKIQEEPLPGLTWQESLTLTIASTVNCPVPPCRVPLLALTVCTSLESLPRAVGSHPDSEDLEPGEILTHCSGWGLWFGSGS